MSEAVGTNPWKNHSRGRGQHQDTSGPGAREAQSVSRGRGEALPRGRGRAGLGGRGEAASRGSGFPKSRGRGFPRSRGRGRTEFSQRGGEATAPGRGAWVLNLSISSRGAAWSADKSSDRPPPPPAPLVHSQVPSQPPRPPISRGATSMALRGSHARDVWLGKHRPDPMLLPVSEGFDPNDLKFTEEERLMYQRLWDSRGWDVSQDPTVIAAGRKYIFDVILGDPAKPVGHVFHRVVAVVTQTQDFLYKKHKDKITGLEVMTCLGEWLSEHWETHRETLEPLLTPEFKKAVFHRFLETTNRKLLFETFSVFGFRNDPTPYISEVNGLLAAGKFDKATFAVIGLRFEFQFVPHLIGPLLVEDKVTVLEELVKSHKELQLEVVKFLDNLVTGNSYKVSNLVKNHVNQKAVKCLRLQGKPLNKLIDQMLTRFKIDPEQAPNFYSFRKHGEFKYMVSQKTDPSMRLEHWRDLINIKAGHDPDLQFKLLDYLTESRVTEYDVEEAGYWACRWNMPRADVRFPWAVSHYLKGGFNYQDGGLAAATAPFEDWEAEYRKEPCTQRETNEPLWIRPSRECTNDPPGNLVGVNSDWEVPTANQQTVLPECLPDEPRLYKGEPVPEFHQFPLKREDIVFVDTRAAYLAALDELAKEDLTGLDCEYRPCGIRATETVSLMQIASRTRVYLLDFNSLGARISDNDWRKLVSDYFANSKTMILGYGLRSDFSILARTNRAFVGLENKSVKLLDLEPLERRCTSLSPIEGTFMSRPNPVTTKGLAGVVEGFFGLPLDKRDQISDWDRRPLTENQIVYAALDAFVLLEIYEALIVLSKEANYTFRFEKWVKELIEQKNKFVKSKKKKYIPPLEKEASKNKKAEEKQKLLEEARAAPPLNKDPIRARDLKIICDSMLEGLCKKLRLYGVDTVALQQHEQLENCAATAKKDQRMILTRGVDRHQKLKNRVPVGHCYHVVESTTEEQVKEVFRYFNVVVADEDYFSRCQICNNSNYILIPGRKLAHIKDEKKRFNVMRSEAGPDYSDEDDDDDFYDRFMGGDEDEDSHAKSEPWLKFPGGEVYLYSGVTREGVTLKVDDVADGVVEQQEEFFACSGCGKIYWKGSHWDKIKLKDVEKRTAALELNPRIWNHGYELYDDA